MGATAENVHIVSIRSKNDAILPDDRNEISHVERIYSNTRQGLRKTQVTDFYSRKMRRSVIISHSDHFECQRAIAHIPGAIQG